jgi:hypothetical protein
MVDRKVKHAQVESHVALQDILDQIPQIANQ